MKSRLIPKWRIPILMYHQIDIAPKNALLPSLYVSPSEFERDMKYLYHEGFRTISLDFLIEILDSRNRLPRKAVIITFDDGFRSSYTKAFPVLKKYNFGATIFLVSDLIGRTDEWLQKKRGEVVSKMLPEEEIIEMSQYGIEFGAHTCTHPHLIRIPIETARNEILESKRKIEEMLKKPVTSFCYPYGKLNDTVKKIVIEAGYKCACAADGCS